MSDERPEDRQGERDSQLSAMFDGELPAAECELLARRLVRDDALRSLWSRYALIGAALRRERGVKLDDRIARRVQAQMTQEPTYGDVAAADAARIPGAVPAAASPSSLGDRWMRFARPVVGVGIAAGVAAISILWLRTQDSPDALVASTPASQASVVAPEPVSTVAAINAPRTVPATQIGSSNGEPERYTTPAFSPQTSIAPPARLANYVVAHSEYSGPLSRRLALLGLVASDGQAEDSAEIVISDSSNGGTGNGGTRHDAH
jgi:negative regulator of sigma E activity